MAKTITVRQGQDWISIAQAQGVTLDALLKRNPDINGLRPGVGLRVPNVLRDRRDGGSFGGGPPPGPLHPQPPAPAAPKPAGRPRGYGDEGRATGTRPGPAPRFVPPPQPEPLRHVPQNMNQIPKPRQYTGYASRFAPPVQPPQQTHPAGAQFNLQPLAQAWQGLRGGATSGAQFQTRPAGVTGRPVFQVGWNPPVQPTGRAGAALPMPGVSWTPQMQASMAANGVRTPTAPYRQHPAGITGAQAYQPTGATPVGQLPEGMGWVGRPPERGEVQGADGNWYGFVRLHNAVTDEPGHMYPTVDPETGKTMEPSKMYYQALMRGEPPPQMSEAVRMALEPYGLTKDAMSVDWGYTWDEKTGFWVWGAQEEEGPQTLGYGGGYGGGYGYYGGGGGGGGYQYSYPSYGEQQQQSYLPARDRLPIGRFGLVSWRI